MLVKDRLIPQAVINTLFDMGYKYNKTEEAMFLGLLKDDTLNRCYYDTTGLIIGISETGSFYPSTKGARLKPFMELRLKKEKLWQLIKNY